MREVYARLRVILQMDGQCLIQRIFKDEGIIIVVGNTPYVKGVELDDR